MRPVLIVGGAPRVRVDAIRYLTVVATGTTALAVQDLLLRAGVPAEVLLSTDAAPGVEALRFGDRQELEAGIRDWLAVHPDGGLVLSAAINDYELASIEVGSKTGYRPLADSGKIPSGADEVVLRLRPTGKVIDRLRREFGLRGPLVAFKYEDASTVQDSAKALLDRVGADLVVANSLCGRIQCLVGPEGRTDHPHRQALLEDLTARLASLLGRGVA